MKPLCKENIREKEFKDRPSQRVYWYVCVKRERKRDTQRLRDKLRGKENKTYVIRNDFQSWMIRDRIELNISSST